MVRRKREAKASIVDKSHGDNLPAETAAAEIDVPNSVIVDAVENNIQFQSESEVQTLEEAGKENNATLVGKVDESKIDATEEHAAEEVEIGLGESKEEVGKEEECDDYDNDNSDNADFDNHGNDNVDFPDDEDGDDDDVDFDEDEDGDDDVADDYDDDDDDDDFDFHDDEDGDDDDGFHEDDEDGDDDDGFHEDDDNDYDDEKDNMMEEGIDENAKLEDNNSITEKCNDGQRNIVEEGKEEENAKEENEDREHGNMKKKVQTLRKGSKRKEVTREVSDKMTSKNEDKQEKEGQGDAMKEPDKENAKEENEDREDGSFKKKVKTLRRGRKRKKVTTEVSDKMASEQKDLKEEDGQADRMEEEDEEDIREKEEPSKQRLKKLSKISRRKVEAGGFEKEASRQDDKVESSRRKKSSKKVRSMGMIFMCSSKTKKDCYHYKVLGLPANKKDVVGKIYKGMRLFLYDFDLKLMYGIYKAAGPGGFNIEPRAFSSQFPAQVRFTVVDDCLPLAEEKFKKVIKDNYFTKTKFDCQLTSHQVRNLCKLFISASKGSKATRLARRQRSRAYTDRERNRAWGDKRPSARDEKHRYHEHNRRRGREVVASSVSRLLLPAAAPTPSYPYDRTLELDAYRREVFVEHPDPHRHPVLEPRDAYRTAQVLEHHDFYRRDPPLHHPDSYRRDLAAEHLDLRLRDGIGRRDPYISFRERPERPALRSRDDFGRHDPYFAYRGSSGDHNLRSQDEIGRHDPYISYREHPAHCDHSYDTGPLPEHDHCRPISRSTEYRSVIAPLPEYRSARPVYRY